ncbi:unnamed protein product [Euphydryas editha]|uniref:C2H2-type domain-containing protein n=1 Tax=Euphydryas editha TaxID=104508 RepID=A0AAU9T9A9_EUPED|nr:unnamed protein product [Euphydryas editha]
MSAQDMNIIIKDFSSVCRGCLESSREMKNMFDYGLDEDFYKLTNIKINRSDDLSKLLCTECEEVITRCRNFHKQCTQSDFILNIVVKKQSTDELYDGKVSRNSVTYFLCDKKLTIKVSAPDTESKISYHCTEKCPERFMKKNDLLQHFIKRHNFDNNFVVNVEYYCSIPNCHYNVSSESGKHFTGRKYLNQHISKVHKEKITCKNCLLNFPNSHDYERHLKKCCLVYTCQVCDKEFKTNERLLVHLLRKHPELHKKYKMEKKAEKRKNRSELDVDKAKTDEKLLDFADSPKRSFATQTSELRHIKNDVTLLSWQEKVEDTKKDEISTQTFDLLSLKSQMSEDDSIFYSENVSLSDIQTQTLPLEFGLSRSNKETITSETQSPDLSIKETQTCFCLYDSLKSNFKCGDLMASGSLCTTETQTLSLENDLLSFSSAETQTCFEDDSNKDF